jgi:hypothetical protein
MLVNQPPGDEFLAAIRCERARNGVLWADRLKVLLQRAKTDLGAAVWARRNPPAASFLVLLEQPHRRHMRAAVMPAGGFSEHANLVVLGEVAPLAAEGAL